MTYYCVEMARIRRLYYPGDTVCSQVMEGKRFIDQHFDEPISLADIARKALISRYHFLRLFKRLYGCTPHQYMTQKRIEEAWLLLARNMPVREVCLTVGFESIPSFKALFKKYTRQTPASFRKKQFLIQPGTR